jgi:glycosyltransferase involved in cell wall biosynthesis
MTPLVSVIVGNYNYAAYVGEAIESVLAQTHPRVEVIVVDDGSTDGSRAVIERYGDRVRALFKPNAGQGSVYNAGFRMAQGELVLFLDSDDVLLPTAERCRASQRSMR